ncbi:hypothetical protein RIF29_37931 [Crotalaria pallida]|uniref:CCHC-type domain-containing protein n=1 Tax=Crotalaria pallida TaxID=3830 RepID=A0AAN9DYN1_CROPI
MVQEGVSFRDKMMGGKAPPPRMEEVDLVKANLMKIISEDGNRLTPKVFLDDSVFERMCLPWKDALVVKLLGKSLGFLMMRDRLRNAWKLQSGFDLMDVGNGFYVVKFDAEEDREKVMVGGPWMIFDHCLSVQRWDPDFVSPATQVNRTLVWIRFPGLNLMFYDKSFLLGLASAVGVPNRVDMQTVNVTRGKFARVCVEIDLTMPVVGKVWFRDHWYKVEYEGLHLICATCGCYGHLSRNCTKAPPKPPVVEVPVHGEGGFLNLVTPDPGLVANQSGDTTPEITAEVSKENPEEQLHGDWLVVRRRKKGGSEKKKGLVGEKSKENNKQSLAEGKASQQQNGGRSKVLMGDPISQSCIMSPNMGVATRGKGVDNNKKRARTRAPAHVTHIIEKEGLEATPNKVSHVHGSKPTNVQLSELTQQLNGSTSSSLHGKDHRKHQEAKGHAMKGFDLGPGITISPNLLGGIVNNARKTSSPKDKPPDSLVGTRNSGNNIDGRNGIAMVEDQGQSQGARDVVFMEENAGMVLDSGQ